MSIDEIFASLDNYEPGSLPDEVVTAIKAALKAGQAMHKGYTILERQARQCGFVDSREHEILLKAWDAVTKEYI